MPGRFGPFHGVKLDNAVTLIFIHDEGEFPVIHDAFLLSEAEFDQIFACIRERGLPWWADPGHRRPSQIIHGDGGRGVYWDDPDGHRLEILMPPYGSGVSGSSLLTGPRLRRYQINS